MRSAPEGALGPRLRRAVVLMNVLATILGAAFVVLVLTRPVGTPPLVEQFVTGEEALREAAASAGVPEGEVAPGFEPGGHTAALGLTDLDGRPLALRELAGRPVWIVFWATTCHACQEEEPDLRRAYESRRGDGLVVLAIDVGEDAETVRRYVEERSLPWQIALDPALAAYDAYGAIGTPTHYFVGTDGRIVSRAFGRLELDEMNRYLDGILPPAS